MKTFFRNLKHLLATDLAELKSRTHSRITGLDTRLTTLERNFESFQKSEPEGPVE